MRQKRSFMLVFVFAFLLAMLGLISCGKKAQQPEGEVKENAQSSAKQPLEAPAPPKGAEPSKGIQPPPQQAPQSFLTKLSPQTVVARVNGTEIKAWLVTEVTKIHRDQVTKQLGVVPPEIEGSIAQTAVDQIIKSELLYQQALKEGLKADEKVVEEDVKSVRMSFPNEQSFKDFLQAVGYGEEELRTETRKNLIINSYLKDKIIPQVRVSEADAKDYYDKNKEKFKAKELVRASYILFSFGEDISEDRKALLKEQAQKVLKEAKSGQDFAELAKKYSKAPNADKGGDLGYFPRGKMLSNFEKIAFSLGIGEISDVFETQFGYNIVKIADKKPEGYMPFEEIKFQVLDILMMQKVEVAINKKLDTLKSQAKIEILIKEAQLPPQPDTKESS